MRIDSEAFPRSYLFPLDELSMKLTLVFLVTSLAWLAIAQPVAPPSRPSYTTNTLLALTRLVLTNAVDEEDAEMLVRKRGASFTLDAGTAINMFKSGVATEEEIQRMETILNGARSLKSSLALDASTSTNLVNLLTNVNSLGTNLNALGNNLAAVGTNISGLGTNANLGPNSVAFGGAMETAGTNLANLGHELAKPKSPSIPYYAFMSSGAKFLSPYTVNVNSNATAATLGKSGDSTVPFLEFTFINRHVLHAPQETDGDKKGPILGAYFVSPVSHLPDIESHIGFTFGSGTGPTNYSASTIAGGGDFYSDASVGLPFLRRETQAQRQQVSLELGGGVVTEKNFVAVHPNVFLGLGYETSFRPGIVSASTNRAGFLSGRFGAGWLDIPSMTSSSNTIAIAMSGGLPQFKLKPSPTLGIEFDYPLTDTIFLNIAGNAYIRSTPAPWNITVGVSIPLDTFAKMFSLPFGSSSP